MKLRYMVIAAAAVLALAASAETAKADWGCSGPGCGQPRNPTLASALFKPHGRHPGVNLNSLHQHKLPVFQAAPWYNYWPYDGHFLTPAPVSGPFYGPPMTGNFPVNPYFPGPGGAAGFGHGIPGGPLPGGR